MTLSTVSAFLCAAILSFQALASAETLTIYSTHKQRSVQNLLNKFLAENKGVEIAYFSDVNWELVKKLEAEKATSKGDIYFTKDLVYLNETAAKDLLIPFTSAEVAKNIPAYMIDKNNLWTGLGLRARTMVYNPSSLNPAELSTYEDLGDSKWTARMCLRTSLSSYSVAYVASMIMHLGYDRALQAVKGWVANTVIDPTIGDELLLANIDAGVCEVGVMNTHYLAEQQMKKTINAKPFFADQATTGAHMNGSGIGILKTTQNKALATKFIEFMTRKDVQEQWGREQMEYPANVEAEIPASLAAFGNFKKDETPWSDFAPYLEQARQLFKDADYQ
ncbi:extracellular solute-binding protein [Bdellovibrio sp. NC01]|uniref:extracellular solute-binding protein n=1 Tax=Bdellovibrio sp. NC01 TaxID=2220073 RepID=UPI00143CD864|nr:extracellular solute-binding protein [Bdellovibrio sp. NC01]